MEAATGSKTIAKEVNKLRNQWGYAAIAAMFGIAAACSHASAVSVTAAAAYVVYCFWRLRKGPFIICLISLCVCFIYTNEIERNNQPSHSSSMAPLSAVIVSSPIIDGDKLSFTAKTTKQEKLRMVYTISSPEEKEALKDMRAGMVCMFTGERDAPQPARNFGSFDYKEYLHRQHIHSIYNISAFSSCYEDPSFWQWLFSIRQQAVQYVQDNFSGDAASFINALVYGDRQAISSEIEESYQQLGLIHLLAISGSHITVLIAACYYVLLRLGSTRETATVLLLIVIPLYMYMAGASPSVVRASVTAVVVLSCLLFSARISGIDALSLSAICMLMFDPYVLFDIGFQFSFSATFVLLLSSTSILSSEKSMLHNMWNVAVAAQLASLPISLHYFGQISPYSIIFNLIYVPFLSFIILPLCLCALFLSMFLPFVSQWIETVLSLLLSISNKVLFLSEKLPYNKLIFGQAPAWLTVCYCIVILVLFTAWEDKRRKRYVLPVGGGLILLLTAQYLFPYFNPYGNITFLDVGQGDAILIQLPYAKGTYMIDTGGTIALPKQAWQKRKNEFSVGDDIVVPYLQSKGIRRIDKLILTHGDADHVGAALEVLSSVRVGEVVLGRKNSYSDMEQQILQGAQQKGVRIVLAGNGMKWRNSDAYFEALSPFGEEEKENDQSVVLRARVGGLTWLFTGDLEERGEEQLITSYNNLSADVLKVGHHGSKTSTSDVLLETVQPRVAIISVGRKNRYGHPHEEVLQRLRRHGAAIWRTDEDGAITYIFSKGKGTFRTRITYDESTAGGR
ncbi:DNA internalization-related competence protein ComEC/Rec2 [Ectobacillus funiculus]|uniref:DNA internalization-related competence protein ComEC/Rec2 n=1 Tax=Ectobacillus funiculus TaxID=137993 RepID=UPI001FE58988|nr:DNA internalization-related competence protein ComEC/Rec2 [Ectobacillus funiculus]